MKERARMVVTQTSSIALCLCLSLSGSMFVLIRSLFDVCLNQKSRLLSRINPLVTDLLVNPAFSLSLW